MKSSLSVINCPLMGVFSMPGVWLDAMEVGGRRCEEDHTRSSCPPGADLRLYMSSCSTFQMTFVPFVPKLYLQFLGYLLTFPNFLGHL